MTTPDEDRFLWQQNVLYATEIAAAIHHHAREASPVPRALEPFKNRIHSGLESLRALHGHAQHDFRVDGMTILRAMYDAHLQALFILADPLQADDRARLFIEYRWIEQRRMQKLLERSPTQFARTLLQSPRQAAGEAAREENFQRLRPNYLTRKGELRADWYPGTLRELAEAVALASEYEILQRILSGAVHSTPTALLAGLTFSNSEHLLLIAWRIMFRVLGRIAQHHRVPLAAQHVELVRAAMKNLYDQDNWRSADSSKE